MDIKNKIKKAAIGFAATATTALVPVAAFAGELDEAVSQGVDKTVLTAIGVVALTITGIILLIRSGKKAAS